MVTVAPGSAPPLLSATDPLRLPYDRLRHRARRRARDGKHGRGQSAEKMERLHSAEPSMAWRAKDDAS